MKKMLSVGIIILSIVTSIGILKAQDYSKSSRPWGSFKKVETEKDYEALPDKSKIAMACSKCKSVTVINKKELATKPGHGMVEEVLVVDSCPGCGGKITTKSSGKETAMVHTCSKCGDDSPYCCATKSSEKTHGMSDK